MAPSDRSAAFRRRASGRGTMARLTVGLWLGLYALVVAVVPVVDAGVGHGAVVAHWEDASDTTCPPQHDASACQLCQLITGPGRENPGRAVVAVPASDETRPAAAVSARAPAAVAVGVPSSRAPPVV
jgi:hypothetical protein